MVNRCEFWQKQQASQIKEKLENVVSEVPNIPWNTISTDLFSFEGEHLIIADCYSKYPFVEELTAVSSKAVTEKTLKIFPMFGIPNTVISDNGPQFIGMEYKELDYHE